MSKKGCYVAIFWVIFGMFVSIYAYTKLGIGKLNAPKPGLMPFVLGLLFSLLAVFTMIRTVGQKRKQNESREAKPDQQETVYKKVILVIVALYAYAILLEPLGFILTTFLTMTVLFRSAGLKRWITAAGNSGLVVLITYFLFTYLGVRFPPGVLRPLGLY